MKTTHRHLCCYDEIKIGKYPKKKKKTNILCNSNSAGPRRRLCRLRYLICIRLLFENNQQSASCRIQHMCTYEGGRYIHNNIGIRIGAAVHLLGR